MQITITREYHFDKLSARFPFLEYLPEELRRHSGRIFNRDDRKTEDYQVLFMGKSGYGKSSTINALIGQNAMITSDVEACTKAAFTVEYALNEQKTQYLSFCDLPGIAESKNTEEEYISLYENVLYHCFCIVYVLRADQRDYANDLALFQSKLSPYRSRLIIAINCADKAAPISRNSASLTADQIANLEHQRKYISQIFHLPQDQIMFYSAKERLYLDVLMRKIYGCMIR